MNSIPCGPWRDSEVEAREDLLTGEVRLGVRDVYLEKCRFGQEPMQFRFCVKVNDA